MCSLRPIVPVSAGKMNIETKASILPPRVTVIEGLKISTETSATATTIIVINRVVVSNITDRLLSQGSGLRIIKNLVELFNVSHERFAGIGTKALFIAGHLAFA